MYHTKNKTIVWLKSLKTTVYRFRLFFSKILIFSNAQLIIIKCTAKFSLKTPRLSWMCSGVFEELNHYTEPCQHLAQECCRITKVQVMQWVEWCMVYTRSVQSYPESRSYGSFLLFNQLILAFCCGFCSSGMKICTHTGPWCTPWWWWCHCVLQESRMERLPLL